jgi:esterase/lipase superfamily enzyme
MLVEYHKWWSPNLQQDMEIKVYGHYGKPMLVFPTQGGRFYEYEDFRMIDAIQAFIDGGKVKAFTVDSIDNQSWTNFSIHPAERAKRHEDYDRYIVTELVPFIRHHCVDSPQKMISTGCSMGAFHATNFYFRHPDIFDVLIAISGPLDMKLFIGDYMDETVYFNSPLNFLPSLDDRWYIDLYRQSKIIICTGQGAWEEPMIEDAVEIKKILEAKGIPHWVDFWGYDVNHDWPWWRKMVPNYLDKLEL